jgi:Flp pilus assembly protein TadB
MGLFSSDVARAFGQCRTADGPEYWDNPDSRAHEHRRHVRNLLVACTCFVVAGLVVHPSLLVLLVVLGPFLALEWFMLRRTGNRRSPISPSTAADVEIELEPNQPDRS